MDRKAYNILVSNTWQKIINLANSKGADYAGNDDVLSNFKRQAKVLGLSPEQVWAVYSAKHFDAIMTYCKNGAVKSEPIESRVYDLIVYLTLLLAMVEQLEDQRVRLSVINGMKYDPKTIGT